MTKVEARSINSLWAIVGWSKLCSAASGWELLVRHSMCMNDRYSFLATTPVMTAAEWEKKLASLEQRAMLE